MPSCSDFLIPEFGLYIGCDMQCPYFNHLMVALTEGCIKCIKYYLWLIGVLF